MKARIMNSLKLLIGFSLLLTYFSCNNKERIFENRFDGMWQLDKIESLDRQTGNWKYDSTFSGWNGLILYDGNGHMGVQITPKGYKDFDVNKNIDSLNTESLKKLVKFYQSNWVYFANYQITGDTIEHERLSATNPKDWGVTLTRNFEFREDTLILIAHEYIDGIKSRLWWVKL